MANTSQEKGQEKVWDAIAEQWYHFRQKQFKDVKEELEKLSRGKKEEKKSERKERC